MERNKTTRALRFGSLDWAVLYMRLFAGAGMLLHDIGKMQTYDEFINSYPSLPGISSATLFALVTSAEALLAVLIVMGLYVRTAATLMSLGLVVAMICFPADRELRFVWLGIYLFLILSGSGLYGFDGPGGSSEGEK